MTTDAKLLAKSLIGRVFDGVVARSLANVERAFGGWRAGGQVRDAHVAVLHHTFATERSSEVYRRVLEIDPTAVLVEACADGHITREQFRAAAGCDPEERADVISSDKMTTVGTMLAEGVVKIQIDARIVGVDVPAHLRNEPALVLRIGRGLTPPIRDLDARWRGITATLAFNGVPHTCVIPWRAVYVVGIDGNPKATVSWPGDAPSEVVQFGPAGAPLATEPAPAEKKPEAPKGRGHLRLV